MLGQNGVEFLDKFIKTLKRNKTQELHTLYALYLTVYNETALLQNNMFSFSVSDIKMEEGIFINLVEKHEKLTNKQVVHFLCVSLVSTF